MFLKIRKPNSSDIIMVIGMFEYIINTIMHSRVLNWSERENVITTDIKYHCNTEESQPVHDYDFFEYSFTHDCTSV